MIYQPLQFTYMMDSFITRLYVQISGYKTWHSWHLSALRQLQAEAQASGIFIPGITVKR